MTLNTSYAAYVYTSYLITVIVLAVNIYFSVKEYKQ